MTLVKGMVIGFLALCALALAGCFSMLSGGARDLGINGRRGAAMGE